jgi:parallel beta-helix repeat protein
LFIPGDSILFNRGNIWRERLVPPSSGTQDFPITYGAYGIGNDPIISGSNIVKNWTLYQANIWQATVIQEPKVVLFNGIYGINTTSVSQLSAENQWSWSGSTLYVYSLSDPSASFLEPGIEAGARDQAMYIGGKNFIVFRNINFHVANLYVVFLAGGVEGLTFDGCNFNYGYEYGIVPESTPIEKNIIIKNCITKYNGSSGIHAGDGSSNWLIQNNTSIRDSYLYGTGTTGALAYGGGIKVWGTAHDIIIENNKVMLSGKKDNGSDVNDPTHGFGIWLDTAGDRITIRYNTVTQCAMYGITVEKTSNASVYYNISFKNEKDGISMHGDDKGTVAGNEFYNNVSYGNGRNGISAWGPYMGVLNSCNKNVFRNNVAVANGVRQFSAKWGCENKNTYGSGNVYDHNSFGVEKKNFIEWGSTIYKSTYATFEKSYGSSTYSVTADPLFVDPAKANFTLQTQSAGVDAGINVGLIRDFARTELRDAQQKPNIGAYE